MEKVEHKIQKREITPEEERRMRIIANLLIDKIFEDKSNNSLKFKQSKKAKQK